MGRRTYSLSFIIWKDVRVVDGAVLERLCTERYRGFESPSFRILPRNEGIRNEGTPSCCEVSQHGTGASAGGGLERIYRM